MFGEIMKKPVMIYAIAVWTFFQSAFYISVPLGIISKFIELSPNSYRMLRSMGFLAALIVLIGLTQLKRTPRIITKIFVIIALLVAAKIYLTILLMGKEVKTLTHMFSLYRLSGTVFVFGIYFRKAL
jgi:hypothetical protein